MISFVGFVGDITYSVEVEAANTPVTHVQAVNDIRSNSRSGDLLKKSFPKIIKVVDGC